jgi:hypothetical protein
VPPHVRRELAAGGLLGRDEARRHVRLPLDGVGVEPVPVRVAHVDEDRVVLGRPPPARLGPVVVGPHDLVQEAVPAEDLVAEQLHVVRLAVVQVQVERAPRVEQPAGLMQPRLQEPEVVVEAVAVGRALEELAAVAAPAEPGAVAVGVGDRRERAAGLEAAGVERRVEVGQRHRLVRLGAQEREVVTEQDAVHATERIRAPGVTRVVH